MFLIFQVLCISFLVKYNKTYEAAYSNAAHSVTGGLEKKYNNIQYFFDLKKTNRSLVAENATLRNALSLLKRGADTLYDEGLHSFVDSLHLDSSVVVRKYDYFPAKVVNNSLTKENNFITIEKGSKQGVKVDMAVAGPKGIVGRVVSVSPNYSIVMSLLNHSSHVSGMMKNSMVSGYIEWDGKYPNILTFNNIPKRTKLKIGDSVLTSNLSGNFPEGLMIGRVVQFEDLDPSSNFYQIKILTSTDFYNLQYVYVIQNQLLKEQRSLEAKNPNK